VKYIYICGATITDMKTIVIDTILNRQWEFEDMKTFEDARLRRIQDELRGKLSHTSWDILHKTVTLFSEESYKSELSRKRAQLFKDKGVPTHIVISAKFYDIPVRVRDSQLRRDYTDIGDGYRTIKVPLDHYEDVVHDLSQANCKIIGEEYLWETQEAIRN